MQRTRIGSAWIISLMNTEVKGLVRPNVVCWHGHISCAIIGS